MEGTRALAAGPHVLPGTQAPLPGIEAVLIGLVALAVVLIPLLWPLAGNFSVMAHEGGHAVAGAFLGFPARGMRLNRNATGATSFPASIGGLRDVIITLMGYLGPSGFGLCAAKLIERGHVITVLWLAVILLAALLFLIRESFGLVSVPVAIAALALIARYGHTGLEEFTAYLMTWVLLLSGVRFALAHGPNAADAWDLASSTRLPRGLWALVWLAGTLLAVVIGGKWMVLLR
jgi:hypothetical protein